MDLAAYRLEAEAFTAALGEEYHGHFAGLRRELDVEPIYARHAALFAADSIARLRDQAAAAAAQGEDAARRARMLLDFAVEGHIGLVSTDLEAELAQREAGLQLSIGDGTDKAIPFREAPIAQANEPDRARRAAIEAARLEVTETHLNPLHREALERTRAVAVKLGWPSYRALCEELKGFDLDRLSRATEAFTAATDEPYDALVGPVVARTLDGVTLVDLARADLPRLFRFAEADAAFDGAQLLPSFEATLAGLGIDPAAQGNVHLDVASRPGKSPRAFCVAVRVPQDVRLVVPPIGGRDDFTALLHEGGHVEHYAHVDPSLAFEYRHLGDNAVTEAFAFLFDHLVEDPEWLRARLGVQDADGTLAAHARATRLIYLRRYASKLAYELDVHRVDPPADDALRERYATLLGAAARVDWPAATYLADLDPGFYVACYLRAWALETHLRAHLRERFGERWFARREAGNALRALWRDGQRLSAEELLGELTGAELDFGALLADLGLEGALR
ncbi:MAG TPA: hypothetical protein VFF79_11615 [Conexibacter sp.]|jgi:hypothetical protein|nr:hypothetical protein [Conexibacter sp.]